MRSVYTMKVHWNDTTRTEKILSKNVYRKEPASGWDNFMKRLFDLQIMSLPDMSRVPGYEELDGADGASYFIEFATKDKYRFYGYWEPAIFTQFWEARNMEEILRLIEQELDFKRLKK